MIMSILLNEVEYIYGKGTPFENVALYDVTLKIGKGEFVGLAGHTGSGKSTLIQHMNGLLKPTSGGVYYHGEDINEKGFSKKKLRSKISIVFQYPEQQLFESTVLEDVKFGPKNLGIPNLEVDLRAYEALKQVGIKENLLDVSPLELSGGEKRRVAIAGVLAMEPEVLILDEPTAALDPRGRDEIWDLIQKLHDERDVTTIVVSHSMEDLGKYAERLIVMNGGTIAYDGIPEDVFSHYKELEKMGILAPQVTYVMQGLAEKGIELPHSAINVEQAVDAIYKSWCAKKEV
jgi:energy-coupling factor transport system ATP-binding protein